MNSVPIFVGIDYHQDFVQVCVLDSNDKKLNPNVTVLEFLNRRPGFKDRVAAVTSWDVFPWIINTERSGVPVNAGWTKPDLEGPEMAQLEALAREVPKAFSGVRYDYWTSRIAEQWLKDKRPRVLYVSFGETDDWAHAVCAARQLCRRDASIAAAGICRVETPQRPAHSNSGLIPGSRAMPPYKSKPRLT